MKEISGLHHVTCISGDAQENLDFYTGVLGMRMVKKSVNQDSPDTYHLFYADADGHPGTDITFFPWPRMPAMTPGVGLSMEVSLAIPAGTLDYWSARLGDAGVQLQGVETRHGERALPFVDPHGLHVALVETADVREFTPWDRSDVPAERQVLGLHAVRLWERSLDETAAFLTSALGLRARGGGGMAPLRGRRRRFRRASGHSRTAAGRARRVGRGRDPPRRVAGARRRRGAGGASARGTGATSAH
ncbi:MAG: VOC family protein [Gemmatimonadaceae bacterium]